MLSEEPLAQEVPFQGLHPLPAGSKAGKLEKNETKLDPFLP